MSLFKHHLDVLERLRGLTVPLGTISDKSTSPPWRQIIEAALMCAGRPLNIDDISMLLPEDDTPPTISQLQAIMQAIADSFSCSGMELVEVASGYRIQTRAELAPWISRLWPEGSARLSRSLMETLMIIAHQQPVTRTEIEDIRGVAVSSMTIHTLLEAQWVKALGKRDTPGRPSVYGTTPIFLDHFGLKSLSDLPLLMPPQPLSVDSEKPVST
jgi:segregation and condensation protein B